MPDLTLAGYPANTYQRDDLFTASPVRLVVRVLAGAITALDRCEHARGHSGGNLFRKELNRARGLVSELFGALDKQAGGEVAVRLEALYEYILTQLLGASAAPNSSQLHLAGELLTRIKEGFDVVLETDIERARLS